MSLGEFWLETAVLARARTDRMERFPVHLPIDADAAGLTAHVVQLQYLER